MSVDTYWDESYYPGMGTGERVPPVITSPEDGATVAPVHDVSGTAQPGQLVTLWSAIGDDPLHVHANVAADDEGNWAFTGTQVTGRDGDVATFVARTVGGSSDPVLVTVAGPVLASIDPDTAEAGTEATFTLTGQRLDSTPVQVRISDGGTVTRIDPDAVTATTVTFTATFATEGTATVSLAEPGDGRPVLTDSVDVAVTAAAEDPEPEPEPEP